jgi:UDP-N-acetylmuramoyl-L-alanyl-D-glutamate--2,6-diaminopimelate ligase
MKLLELIRDLPYLMDTKGDMTVEIEQLCGNSHQTSQHGLFFFFFCIRYDAHFFAGQAVENGCDALIVERYLEDLPVPQVLVSNGRAAMSRVAAAFYGFPAKQMKLVGVTGTKGKTTTTYMLKSILERAGHFCGLVGTTGNRVGDQILKSDLTTPDPIDLHRDLRIMADAGVEYVIMEVSAHALSMYRLDGICFEAGAFTNLSQDHLDFFGDMESYLLAKKRFFTEGYVKNASLNADDEAAIRVSKDISIPHITYGICEEADFYARDIEIHENGVSMELRLHDMPPLQVHLNMMGMFNVYNAIAAGSLALILGMSAENIKAGLEAVTSVPGRVEVLKTHTSFKVILDYSHSPDALENILVTVRSFTKGQIIAVFGCGGDRDQGKRPMMGECGGRLADYCILTSDNPRTEDPLTILNAVEEGIKRTNGKYVIIENRREAIAHALRIAKQNDTVILAGKGHETYQDIMGEKRPFNEKDVVRELLEEINGAYSEA